MARSAGKKQAAVTTTVVLWHFPAEDFELWRETCGQSDDFTSYEAYESAIRKTEMMIRSSGGETSHVFVPVAEMLDCLRKRRLANTAPNRARIVSELGMRTTQKNALVRGA